MNSNYVSLPRKAIKANSFKYIKKAKRLFYREVYNHNIPTGKWIEIFDVKEFVEIEEEHQKKGIKGNCSMKSHLDHHDFHVIL